VGFFGPDSEAQKIFLVSKSEFFLASCSLHGCVNYREEEYGLVSVEFEVRFTSLEHLNSLDNVKMRNWA
jgi:hypothetical protein